MITKYEVRLDMNNRPEFTVTTNNRYTEWTKPEYTTIFENEFSKLIWSKDQNGIVHFGCVQKQDGEDHKAGYVWSSRTSIFNALGCEPSMEICMIDSKDYRFAGAMTVAEVKKHLPDNYTIVETTEYSSKWEPEEIRYSIFDKTVDFTTDWYCKDINYANDEGYRRSKEV